MRIVRKSLHRKENLVLIELLRDLRVREDLRQAELADRLDANQNFVSNVEQGIRRLDVVELRDYAAALGTTFSVLTSMWEARLEEGSVKKARRRQTPLNESISRGRVKVRPK